VLERHHPAAGSSGLSAGIFNRQTPNELEQELRCFSVGRFSDLEQAGLRLERIGYVRIARSGDDLDRYALAAAREQALGVEDARLLDRSELARLVPGMRCDDFAGGLWCPSDGHLDGHELCAAYETLARAAGVDVRHRTALIGGSHRADGVELETSAGRMRCDVAVNAAGPWAGQVAAMLGTHVPLLNQRHEICVAHLPAPADPPLPVVNTYVPGSGSQALYLRPEGATRVLCGLHSHEAVEGHAVTDPDDYARTVASETIERLAGELLARMPGWTDVRLEPGWAGLYPVGRFQVGPHRDEPRVVVAGGLGGVGLTVSAAIGQLAAEWAVLGEARTFAFADQLMPDRPALTSIDRSTR
jgi:sarcosine oxidase subunit beta